MNRRGLMLGLVALPFAPLAGPCERSRLLDDPARCHVILIEGQGGDGLHRGFFPMTRAQAPAQPSDIQASAEKGRMEVDGCGVHRLRARNFAAVWP